MSTYTVFILVIILILVVQLSLFALRNLIFICSPNEVLVFSGTRRKVGDKYVGYRIVKGGMAILIPLIERVDKIDLTNMIIELKAHNAYSKGCIPLHVEGVANVKIAGYEPVLNHAIERLLDKSREDIIAIARATLEGSLRGVLATMTPEELNGDRVLFANKLVAEAEKDMLELGFVVDNLKIQHIHDDVQYLNSIGRIKNAQAISQAKIREALTHADARIRCAENKEKEVTAQVDSQRHIADAVAKQKITDALTKRDALIAEVIAEVKADIARVESEIDVQKARIEQVKERLRADEILPAKAEYEAMLLKAKADSVQIFEQGKARADAMVALSEKSKELGKDSMPMMMQQKLLPITEILVNALPKMNIESITVLGEGNESSNFSSNVTKLAETLKSSYGFDVFKWLESKKESS